MNPPTYIYLRIYECPNKFKFYTGITKNMKRRMEEHNNNSTRTTRNFQVYNKLVEIRYKEIDNISMKNQLVSLANSIALILKPKAKVLFQFYPKNDIIMKEIGKIFIENNNLSGNFIIDNPQNPKKREIFLILEKGQH